MAKLHLQTVIDEIEFSNLPAKWQEFDLERFSRDKTLFDFQARGLENALKCLWLYFDRCQASKDRFFARYRDGGALEDCDYRLNKAEHKKLAKYLLDYYPVKEDAFHSSSDSQISFAHFINRMGFWMATGAGKTLIVVKLIELLGNLIAQKELPRRDILFLAHREDLLDQFKSHVEEFNGFHFDTKINLKNLRDYEITKHARELPLTKNEITVFYYRSDLISDARKDKLVDFRNYDNDGNWYILLDEAHKGDREDSKRQAFYSILSRNGFLFNFSATFADQRDFATCVFNFNLAKFTNAGYGKHIYVSSSEVNAFRTQDDFSPRAKQKIVLKTLLLLTYVSKQLEEIRQTDISLYHRPLLMTLVNSVNVQDSDLELFFKELEKVGSGETATDLLDQAKAELADEFSAVSKPTFEFEDLKCELDAALMGALGYKDVLKCVFNAETPGKVEALKLPGNNNELIFRLMTADKPFGMFKIGDISKWRHKLQTAGYEINESVDNTSYFQQINSDDSDINILMGSRSFYEGWDSNRPNLLLYVNIGIGKDAIKFVLQSAGRGVRIEPQRHQRRRLANLAMHRESGALRNTFNAVKNMILPIETLFVFGTKAQNLKEIIGAFQQERRIRSLGDAFGLNPDTSKRTLLAPVYSQSTKIFADEDLLQKYKVSRADFGLTKRFQKFLGDKVSLVKYNCEVDILKKANDSFAQASKHYDFSETNSLNEPERVLWRVFNFLGLRGKAIDKFKRLEDEIVHFKEIQFIGTDGYEELKSKLKLMRNYPERQSELSKQYGQISPEEFQQRTMNLGGASAFDLDHQKIGIKHLANHYYLPVIVSQQDKIDYLNHIIDVESEARFIEELEEYIAKPDNVFKQFDWWMFSKLDHTLDKISIPYYSSNSNKFVEFSPDFVFWAQKGTRYLILFVDPKGTEHTSAYTKIDGYSRLFETGEQKRSRDFYYKGLTINAKLLLKPSAGSIANVPQEYRDYWFDNFDDFAAKIEI